MPCTRPLLRDSRFRAWARLLTIGRIGVDAPATPERVNPMDPSDSEILHDLRHRLEREHARVQRSVEALERDSEAFRQKAAERDPCAYLSPAAAIEAAEQESGEERRRRDEEVLREIENALERLEDDPVGFFACVRCRGVIASERLQVLPRTRICAGCAAIMG